MKKKKATEQEIAFLAAEHQANLVLLSQTWGEEIKAAVCATENELLGMLGEWLEDLVHLRANKARMMRYRELQRSIYLLRAKGYQNALEIAMKEAVLLTENEVNFTATLTKRMLESNVKIGILQKKSLEDMAKYSFVSDGKTIEENFQLKNEEDAQRITDACRAGMDQGKTVSEVVKTIRGTKAADYEDGILNVSRVEAERMARTTCCALADEAKMKFYDANQDVILGIEHVATLSGNTCLVCGMLDGKIWATPEERKKIPRLPIHENCRCVHLPVTELSKMNNSTRAGEAENYWKEAEAAYRKEHPGKDWNALARSTRLRYYYKAQKDYVARTGKPAFERVPQNMSFKEWLQTKDEKYIRSYLGETRYKLYQSGKLPLERFINPETNRMFTIKELKERDKASFVKSGLT